MDNIVATSQSDQDLQNEGVSGAKVPSSQPAGAVPPSKRAGGVYPPPAPGSGACCPIPLPVVRAEIEHASLCNRRVIIVRSLQHPRVPAQIVEGDEIVAAYAELAKIPGWRNGDRVRVVHHMGGEEHTYRLSIRVIAGQPVATRCEAVGV